MHRVCHQHIREGYGQPDAAADGIAFAASKCVPLPGTFEADECIDCVVGKNSTVTGSEEARACIDCAIGMYIEDIRSDECIDCVIGKCVDEAASTECTISEAEAEYWSSIQVSHVVAGLRHWSANPFAPGASSRRHL